MRLFSTFLIGLALCAFAASAQQTHTQSSTARKRVQTDPAAAELNRLLATAQEAVDKQDFAAAARAYEDYLAKKPDDPTAHYNLGYVYTALSRLDDARGEYERAISLAPSDPKMAPAYQNLGMILLPKDPGAAIEPLRHATELEPQDAHAKWLLGTALERSGKNAAAIEQFEAASKLDDKDVEIRISLGFALLGAGRTAEAEAAYRAALALHPEDDALRQAHLGLARSLLVQKKLDAAAFEFGAYLELEPSDVTVRIDRASVLVDSGKDDDALAELDKAASGGPEGLRALKLRSQILWEKKRYDDAIPVLQKAAAIAPTDPDIAARLGRVYVAKKDYPNALHWVAIAYNMNPSANDLLTQVVEVEYLNQNYGQALAALDALSKREDLPAGSWYLRATCYDKLDRLQEALDAYQKFLQLNNDENSDMYFVSTARVRALTRELKDKKR